MKQLQLRAQAELPDSNEESIQDEALNYPTPAEFFGQLGRVIGVCLGLAVLAHVIVAMVGAQ